MSNSRFLNVLDDELMNQESSEDKTLDTAGNVDVDLADTMHSNDQEDPQFQEEEERTQEQNTDESDEHNQREELKEKWSKAKLLKEKNRELERQNIELIQRMQSMDQQLHQVYDNNIYNYGSNVATTLDVATKEYKQALEQGSVDEIANATANYTMALHEFQNAKKIVEDHKVINDRYQEEQSQPKLDEYEEHHEYNRYNQNEWLRENPELDANSRYYDRNLEKKIISEADKLNRYLSNENMEHLIGSREYLDKLDEFVEYYKNDSSNNKLYGYGVRTPNSMQGTRSNNALSEQESRIAAAAGMSAEEYRAAQSRMPESLKLKQKILRGN